MTVSPDAARAKAAEIQALHDRYRSWRAVEKWHFPKVPAGTLCRIAKSNGAYLPKMHWRALGLIERREPTETEKRISKAARKTADAVLRGKLPKEDYLTTKGR